VISLVLIGVVALLGVLAIVIALQPADFRIARSAAIAAPPARVFEQVNDLHKF
jgi:hypothetical protein